MLRADSSHIMTQIRTLLYGARCAVGAIAHRRLASMRRLDAALPLAIGSMEALVPVPRMPCLASSLPRRAGRAPMIRRYDGSVYAIAAETGVLSTGLPGALAPCGGVRLFGPAVELS